MKHYLFPFLLSFRHNINIFHSKKHFNIARKCLKVTKNILCTRIMVIFKVSIKPFGIIKNDNLVGNYYCVNTLFVGELMN